MGRPYTLNYIDTFALIGDPEFYAKVPFLYYLRERGLALHQQLSEQLVKQNRETGCRQCNDVRRQVIPLFNEIGRQCASLHEHNPAALSPLIDYLAKRLGYRPDPLQLVFRGDDGTRTLRIESIADK